MRRQGSGIKLERRMRSDNTREVEQIRQAVGSREEAGSGIIRCSEVVATVGGSRSLDPAGRQT